MMTRPKAAGNRRGSAKRAEAPPISALPLDVPDPVPPDELGLAGAAVWCEVWAVLRGLLDRKADRLAVLHLSKLSDLEAQLEGIVAGDGMIVVGSQGQPVTHPAAKELSAVRRDMRQARVDLGLTPERRLALYGSSRVEPSELDRWLAEQDSPSGDGG